MRVLRIIALPVSLGVGVALGLAATNTVLNGRPPFGGVRSGPWTAWPDSGTPGADPYQRARYARDGRIPLAAAAGLRFVAETDTAGRPLEGRCSYRLGGTALPAALWTLTLLDPEGRMRQTPDRRPGFTSTELVRDPEGDASIVIARQARPGNWLPTPSDGPFILLLSLYDTPLGSALQAGGPAPDAADHPDGLPVIGRLLYWAAVALLTAGCAHLALILALPSHTADDAFGRLFAMARGNRLQSVAVPDGPGATPFADPAQATAFCLYDLRGGPVAVSLDLGDAGPGALAVHARYGRVLYGLTGHPGPQHHLDLMLMTGDQAARRPAGAATAGMPIRVQTEEPEGFVLGQVLAEAPSEMPAAKAAALRLSCRAAEG